MGALRGAKLVSILGGTVERAYALARSGRFTSISDLSRELAREGYESPQAHLAGRGLRKELNALMKAMRAGNGVTIP